MIQDRIENLIPRIEREIKKLFYITNEDYAGLLTDQGRLLGLPVDQNTFSIKFKYSSPQEWINELLSISQSDAALRYPFIYVNSNTVVQDDDQVYIGETVIAINAQSDWTSIQRDIYSFDPILNNIYRFFVDGCKISRDFSLISQGTKKDHYFYGRQGLYGGEANKFSDYVDAIEINNLKIRLYKKCYD